MRKKPLMCRACDDPTPTRVEVRDLHPYTESGLDNVVLEQVTFHVCPSGHSWIEIPALEGLHRAIALAIVDQPSSPSGPEIRFLRKYLGLSNEDFASIMGVRPEQTSRWTTGAADMNASAENLLRVLVRRGVAPESYPIDEVEYLKGITHEAPKRAPEIRLRKKAGGWQAGAAHAAG